MANKRQAKKRRKQTNVPKIEKTVNELVNIDINEFNRMNKQQMRQSVQILASAANKRLKKLREMDIESPALYRVNKSRRGKFTTRDKNLNQLRAEFMRTKHFLEMRTSTARGWNATINEIIGGLEVENVYITRQNFAKFWRAYNKIIESDPLFVERDFKYEVERELADYVADYTNEELEDLADKIRARMNDLYKQVTADGEPDNGTSNFFQVE